MPLVARGWDASWDLPDMQCMKNNGYSFLVRYASRDPSQAGKNLTKAELDSALAKGLSVCVVWQDSKSQMTRGYSGGQADARDADAFVSGLGLAGIPVYFSCDQDFEVCSSSEKSAIDAYCDGARSVVGKPRMGGYGDDSFCKRQLDAGRISFAWQTFAWSEGTWEQRCQLRQVKNDFAMCGGTIDNDEAWASDYGQWPRPGQPATGTGSDVASAVAFYQGKQYVAYIDSAGHVCVNGGVVDPGSNARSGPGLAIDPDTGLKVVSYTNQAGTLCTYNQDEGSTRWVWVSKGWNAR